MPDTATITAPAPIESKSSISIPWYLWCSALAVTSVTVGGQWDVSWHRSIGRDTFWTPAHIAIYLCGVLAGIACGYLILYTTLRRPPEMVANSVRVLGFTAPLGAFLAAWGGIAMLTSAPFDNWWHNAYGLDVKIVSPPHTLLMIGIIAIQIGSLLLILAAMNRAENDRKRQRQLRWLFLYMGGMLLMLLMFFNMEFSWDVLLHRAGPYVAISICVPLCYAVLSRSSQSRWASTALASIYTFGLIAIILVLPLFPAEPKLGPVFQPVTHFVPPKFPILILAPAVLLDLLWARMGRLNSLLIALISGPVFVLSLVAAEWPFASFLMTKASQNRLFATGYHSYDQPTLSVDVTRTFLSPQHGGALWGALALAMVWAAVGIWLGMRIGGWMRKVQR